jgi:DNA-binding NarL/FixJ family response regulator
VYNVKNTDQPGEFLLIEEEEIGVPSNSDESERIKVLIADDKILFAKGTVSLLCIEPRILVIGVARNRTECIELVEENMPDVVLLDINLLISDGVNQIDEIKKVQPEAKIIIMTGQNLQDYVSLPMVKGAAGIMLKDSSFKEMAQTIFRVYEGGISFPQRSETSHQFLKNSTSVPFSLELKKIKKKLLNTREIEILELVSKGFHNKEIAENLGIKVRTVDLHVRNILSKLGVSTRFEAVLLWAYVDMDSFREG